ncbi:MAG TPA: SpaH/EbpB family LPXTG-anchored major pilin [Microbacteriaceae bacterium]|nr:SpaH/EbpB family LPXTG-anchored major pilin [Microbacteriaceae bacterium]
MIAKSNKIFLALTATLAMLLSMVLGASAAYAAPIGNPTQIDPDANTTLVIHKVEQPHDFGLPADGLPIDNPAELPPPVQGANFTATLVPGINITTYAGWQQATEMTIADAHARITWEKPVASGTTDVNGLLHFDLKVGLYYIDEVSVPAGVVAAEPFLAVLPMNAPETSDWLYSVHAYPKNPRVSVDIGVYDCKAVRLGDTVSWTSNSDIPRKTEIDGYVVQNIIVPELLLTDRAEQVGVKLQGKNAPKLESKDFKTTVITVDGKETIAVEFTATGRAKLAKAKELDPSANVEISYNTSVLGEGAHVNEVRLFADLRAINGTTPPVTDEAVTKWGPLSVVVHEYNKPANLIEGARFKLYLTEADAIAGVNQIEVEGISEWQTDEQGRLIIPGLRFSNFANGLDLPKTAGCYQIYWAMPTFIPAEWQWVNNKPLAGEVNSTVDFETLIFEVEKTDTPVPPVDPEKPVKPEIPVTGGQVTGTILLAGVLLAGGTILLMRRTRKES